VRFARPLLLLSLGDDPAPGLALARALSPGARAVHVRLCVPQPGLSLGEPDLLAFERRLEEAEVALAACCAAEASVLQREDERAVVGEVVVGEPEQAIDAAIADCAPDLVIFGGASEATRERMAGAALEVARARRVASACVAAARAEALSSLHALLYPFDGGVEALAPVGALLRDRSEEDDTVVFLALGAIDPRLIADPAGLGAIAGIRARIEVSPLSGGWLAAARALDAIVADAIVLSADLGGLAGDVAVRVALRALARGARPLIFAPSLGERPSRDGVLDAPDVWIEAHRAQPAWLRLERLGTFGAPTPLDDGAVDVVASGRRVAIESVRHGRARLPRLPSDEAAIGLGRAAPGLDPALVIEVAVALETLSRRDFARVALVDARLAPEAIASLLRAIGEGEPHAPRAIVAVRVVEGDAARDARARLRAAGLARLRVFDVRELLDEGDPTDVPIEVAPVRLCRAAARLRAAGVPVDLVVAVAAGRARGAGFAVIDESAIERAPAAIEVAYRPPPETPAQTLAERLDLTTDSRALPGHALHVELDNAAARVELIALVDGARERVHAQWYIAEDDEVGREVEGAFARAAARGVAVRLLFDSLYSLHGSLGAQNPLLVRLAAVPGVSLRASRPIDHVPTLEELKQRDHRKILVADGARALVSGRNLGREYYRAFEEARVSARSTYRDLPWLDASARLEGPAAATLDDAFLEAWVEAGGDPFAIAAPPPAGQVAARVVVHRGLRDAYTLEAYRAILDAARARLIVVNAFPLQLELQHALLSALARGVRLSMLVGRARPAYGDDIPFAGGQLRSVADTLVRARLSALVDAGADVRELAIPPPAGWDATLGRVFPHVHAKLVLGDGGALAIGSANLDVTAGYWESEALVIVEDRAVVADVEARLEALLAGSVAIDPADPKWRDGASLRSWLGRVWPSVVG
jgi:phosphatidylserine/phosphatidylglycerophosphate/cardiolipin synthase-like enzyme